MTLPYLQYKLELTHRYCIMKTWRAWQDHANFPLKTSFKFHVPILQMYCSCLIFWWNKMYFEFSSNRYFCYFFCISFRLFNDINWIEIGGNDNLRPKRKFFNWTKLTTFDISIGRNGSLFWTKRQSWAETTILELDETDKKLDETVFGPKRRAPV